MDSMKLSYSEVSTYHLHASAKGEISLDIGANQSTLQDFKLAESVGYYCYKDSNVWSSPTCNRFIYWRSNKDYIQFYEVSLDFNLARNHVQLRFHNTPILDGVSVHETEDQVIILLATVASIHRITLTHPRKLGTVLIDTVRSGSNILPHGSNNINPSDLHTRKSIFYDLNAANLRNPDSYHVLNNSFNLGGSLSSSDMPFPIRSCSWLNSDGEAYFALADYTGNISVIKMNPSSSGKVTVYNLKQTGLIKSLWYNLVPSRMSMSRGNPDNEQAALSILWHHLPSIEDDLMITLCRDLKIRIWSCAKQDYVAAESIESFQDMSSGYSTTSINKSVNDPMIVTRPVLKKDASSNGSDELFLAAFVPTTSGRKFIVYKLLFVGENLTLKVVTSIDALQEDLVDFVFTPNTLWALWRLAESEVTLSHWEINDDSSCWQSVTTYNHFQPPINVKSMLISPKELFIEKIFKKGKFSSQTIAKAISTLNRTHESYYSFLNTESLIEEVANAVENRLRSLPGVGECSPDVYSNLECELWNEFYSYCLQYHNVFNKPLGLFMDSRTGLTGILRVSSVSYLRANDPIDHVLLSRVHTPNYDISNILTDDFSLETSLQQLLQFIKTINSYLDEDAFLQLEMSCTADEPVEKVFREVVNKYLITDPCDLDIGKSNMLSSVEDALESSRILEAVDLILRTLNIESKDHSDEAMDSSVTMVQQSLDQFLSGNIGVCILTESIKQTCRLRFEFCRDLLLFQLLVRLSTTNSTDYDRLCDTLENSIALNKLCLKSYYSMAWISETSMSLKDSTFLGIENTVTLLATLELHEFINVNRNPPTANALVHDFSPKSIVAHLIGHKKCPSARKILSSHAEDVEDPENCQTWLTFQPSLVQAIGTIIWPTSNSSFVLRFLLGFEQFELIDQYSKMLDAWCDHGIASRRFCMGITQLFFGDPKKSVGYFHQALNGLLEEPFLQKIFLANLSNTSIERKPNDSLTNAEITTYFNKLFRLCRLHSQNEIILDLALGAIDLLDESGSSYDQHFSSFMTTIFMCHLEFGNTVDAFSAMFLNPSAIQRKDCLRQFTVKLYEKQAISEMINYDYVEMEDDFINILEFRARSTDLLQTEKKVDFYEILYSYFVKRNNYRKSASIIYEYAKRLCQEVNGVESLKKQARCFLLAINSLKLIDPKYAWIIQPTIKASSSSLHFGRSSSSVTSSIKRKHGLDDAQESPQSDTITRKEIQVLNINDIVKEYELTNARYKLLEKSSQLNSIASTPLSAEETITLLISNLQFDLAFQLSTHFDLPYEPVLEGLVGKYVYLTELPFRKMSLEAGLMEINECFIENDTASASFIANAEMPAIDKMLFLILTYIEKYEEKNQTRLHKCVAEKLLESGIPLPNPLKLSYQKRNSPELLRILMSYDYIESAFNFAMELIDGYLGQGTEYFDIKAPKIGSKQETYFPHQHIKCLLEILEKEKDDHKDYEEFAKQLIHKRDKYRELILSCHQITAR